MLDRPIALQLAEMIMSTFETSGATQTEQYAALDVARALVGVSAASLVTPSSTAAAQVLGEGPRSTGVDG